MNAIPLRYSHVAGDRERIYVVIAYRQPPAGLFMHLAATGKCWFKHATGYHALQIAAALRSGKINGRIKDAGRFLAGTPNYVPFKRDRPDDQKITPLEHMRQGAERLRRRDQSGPGKMGAPTLAQRLPPQPLSGNQKPESAVAPSPLARSWPHKKPGKKAKSQRRAANAYESVAFPTGIAAGDLPPRTWRAQASKT